GLSFILVPTNTPGLTFRPIHSIDARTELNETFLDKVRVPRENLVGEPGMGWTYAKFLLEKERTTSAFLYFNQRQFARAKSIASQVTLGGVRLIDPPAFARKVALIEADLLALEWSVLRILAEEKNRYNLDAVVSALKIRGSEMQQRVTDLQIEALGPLAARRYEDAFVPDGAPSEGPACPPVTIGPASLYLNTRAWTIYGGSREIQKNIIAKLVFGT